MKLSLCMIVRDEEEVLGQCLQSVRPLVEEIVICDTGSLDSTKKIAAGYADVLFDVLWEDNFARARNASFSKASGDYILWLDADDVVTPKNAARLLRLKERLERDSPDTVFCPYRSGGLCYERERILKNDPRALWRGRVHECIVPFGKVVHDSFTVTHLQSGKPRGGRNLEIYRKWSAEEEFSGRDCFYFGRELFYAGLYEEAETWLDRCIAGDGWYVNKIEACKVLSQCFEQQGKIEEALSALYSSFNFGEPRASVLCEIARILSPTRKREAVFWYEAALKCRDHTEDGDFEEPACRGIVPTLGLTALYYALGDQIKSLEYHKKSEALAPDHPSVLYNKKFFGE